MSVWTEQELLTAIANTKLELNHRLGITQYNFSSGMGSQQVTNRSLKELRDHIQFLENELAELRGEGILTLDFVRDIGGI